MALGRVTYLDLTEEQRREGAARAKARLKAMLANPALTEEQRVSLQDQMTRLRMWEAGTLPTGNHVVEIAETVPMKVEVG